MFACVAQGEHGVVGQETTHDSIGTGAGVLGWSQAPTVFCYSSTKDRTRRCMPLEIQCSGCLSQPSKAVGSCMILHKKM